MFWVSVLAPAPNHVGVMSILKLLLGIAGLPPLTPSPYHGVETARWSGVCMRGGGQRQGHTMNFAVSLFLVGGEGWGWMWWRVSMWLLYYYIILFI